MRKVSALSVFFLITSLLALPHANAADAKAGGSCTRISATSVVSGMKFTCIKLGTKLIWSKGTKATTKSGKSATFKAPIPITLPVAQTGVITFSNIQEHVSEIPQVAWQKFQSVITSNKAVTIPNSIYVGPTTEIDIIGGTPRVQELLTKSARLWSGFSQMDFYAVYIYNGADQAVTEAKFTSDFKNKKYDLKRAENLAGPLRALAGTCQKGVSPGKFTGPLGDCTGANSGSYFNSNDSFLHLGLSRPKNGPIPISGGVVGHEYTHAVQAGQWINSPFCGNPDSGEKLCSRGGMSNKGFAPCWINEGIPNSVGVMVAMKSFDEYLSYRNTNLSYSQGPTTVTDYSQASLRNYLFNQSNKTCYEDGPFYKLGYTIGALATEALTSIAGPQATMAVYSLGAEGQDFPTAFKNVYGISWSDASTILSKVLAAQYATFGAPPK